VKQRVRSVHRQGLAAGLRRTGQRLPCSHIFRRRLNGLSPSPSGVGLGWGRAKRAFCVGDQSLNPTLRAAADCPTPTPPLKGRGLNISDYAEKCVNTVGPTPGEADWVDPRRSASGPDAARSAAAKCAIWSACALMKAGRARRAHGRRPSAGGRRRPQRDQPGRLPAAAGIALTALRPARFVVQSPTTRNGETRPRSGSARIRVGPDPPGQSLETALVCRQASSAEAKKPGGHRPKRKLPDLSMARRSWPTQSKALSSPGTRLDPASPRSPIALATGPGIGSDDTGLSSPLVVRGMTVMRRPTTDITITGLALAPSSRPACASRAKRKT